LRKRERLKGGITDNKVSIGRIHRIGFDEGKGRKYRRAAESHFTRGAGERKIERKAKGVNASQSWKQATSFLTSKETLLKEGGEKTKHYLLGKKSTVPAEVKYHNRHEL